MTLDPEKAEVEFELPFEPYPNQLIFMKDAYKCFDESSFGLFESPTGSGKTLSILCSALTWIKNNRSKTMMCDLGLEPSNDEKVPKWVSEISLNHKKKMIEDIIKSEAVKLEDLRKKISERLDNSDGKLRIRENYKRMLSEQTAPDSSELHNSVFQENNNFENPNRTQIIICSRTFSQLNQYVKEFKRLNKINKNVRLSIGSGRSHVCINNMIKSKCKSPEELNDECRRSKCEYRSNTTDLIEITTCYPLDLEDLVSLGKESGCCPYYSNLKTLTNADIVLAPYITVISESLRESLGLRIKDNILIFDEGHNLTDAITESRSCKLTLVGLKELLHQLRSYVNKYKTNFNTIVSDRVSEITKLVNVIIENVSKSESSQNLKITSFTVLYSLEDIKFHEILNFLSSTDFCRHLRGWAEREYHIKKKKDESLVSYTSMIYNLKNFIYSLLYCDSNDQIIITKSEDVVIEIFPVASGIYVLISYIGESRSVVIMSGTLSPIEEFLSLAPSKTEVFIHKSPPVFPLNRFLATINHIFVCLDERGDELVFDYSRRENLEELNFLCNLLELLSEIVPGGIVCFFSSYSYLDLFYNYFIKSSSNKKVLTRKDVFKEQKNINIFPEYSKSCFERGAVLLAVFGGNQSEGVDFSDDLARLVLLVGLPYPPDNIKLSLKRDYYNKKSLESCDASVSENFSKLSNEQRTLLCYKTVNQCIGRAMRHRNDYSAVLLLDGRYKGRDASKYLTGYVRKSILMNENKTSDLKLMLKTHDDMLSTIALKSGRFIIPKPLILISIDDEKSVTPGFDDSLNEEDSEYLRNNLHIIYIIHNKLLIVMCRI
ncbi:chl1 protein, putative [Theileria annulata]|uniref:Chl1 protein, putative n=1 Tax=Theileria annulata TaxID=5874 RepID=Q4UBD0_THEAN|nr:chl1 protein, putative [Theileria annulata]CAI75871.1 chl1 protein, putative [Theileria annulata]|eukprot:XP_955347.1 chl1 protein, putative [Theileria annulata]